MSDIRNRTISQRIDALEERVRQLEKKVKQKRRTRTKTVVYNYNHRIGPP